MGGNLLETDLRSMKTMKKMIMKMKNKNKMNKIVLHNNNNSSNNNKLGNSKENRFNQDPQITIAK